MMRADSGKILGLDNLEELRTTGEGCFKIQMRVKYGQAGFCCRACECTVYKRISTRPKVLQCANSTCRRQESITANTALARKKIALKTCVNVMIDLAAGWRPSVTDAAAQHDLWPSAMWQLVNDLDDCLEDLIDLAAVQATPIELCEVITFMRSVETEAKSADGSGALKHAFSEAERAENIERHERAAQWFAQAPRFDRKVVIDFVVFIMSVYHGISRRHAARYAWRYCYLMGYASGAEDFLRACGSSAPKRHKHFSTGDFVLLPAFSKRAA
jgi:hypothetical protein